MKDPKDSKSFYSAWDDFNFYWNAPRGEQGEKKPRKQHWWNWPERVFCYWYEYKVQPWICSKFGHRWYTPEGEGYSICLRCHVDTDVEHYS